VSVINKQRYPCQWAKSLKEEKTTCGFAPYTALLIWVAFKIHHPVELLLIRLNSKLVSSLILYYFVIAQTLSEAIFAQ